MEKTKINKRILRMKQENFDFDINKIRNFVKTERNLIHRLSLEAIILEQFETKMKPD